MVGQVADRRVRVRGGGRCSPFGRPDSGAVGSVRGAFPDFPEFWWAYLEKNRLKIPEKALAHV
jgi:hypothetical protein